MQLISSSHALRDSIFEQNEKHSKIQQLIHLKQHSFQNNS